jgi:hypothetical protein
VRGCDCGRGNSGDIVAGEEVGVHADIVPNLGALSSATPKKPPIFSFFSHKSLRYKSLRRFVK